MPAAFYVLLGAGMTVAASWALGRVLLARLRMPLFRQEAAVLAFLLGSALLSLVTFALAAAHLVYKGTIVAVAVAALLAAWRTSLPRAESFAPLPRWVWLVCAAPVAAFVSQGFFHAMAPEMSPDGVAYHLGLTAKYYREHGFPLSTTSFYANLTQGVEMLFLFAFAFGRHSGAALTHFAFFLALPWLMLCHGRRFGFAVPAAFAAVFVLCTPVIGMDGASAYNDVAAAAVCFSVFHLMRIWDDQRSYSLLIAAGLLGGFAFAIKYTAFVALPMALVILLWRRAGPRSWIAVAAPAALMITPWLVKNAVVAGNPVSPFLNRWIPNHAVHVSFEDDYRASMRTYNLPNLRQLPLELTVRGQALSGVFGPAWMLVPVALLAARGAHGRWLLSGAAMMAAVYPGNIGARFLIPAAPFLALAMSIAGARWPALPAVAVIAHAVLSWPAVLSLYCDQYAWRFDEYPWRGALRIESEHEYLDRISPTYQIARLVEAATPPGARIFSPAQIAASYTTREIFVPYESATGQSLQMMMHRAIVRDWQCNGRATFHLGPRRAAGVRVVQTASHATDPWIVAEMRVRLRGVEVARDPSWRVSAWPDAWEAQEAFDNHPLTAWSSWRPLEDGMRVEVRFPHEVEFDEVVLESPVDQHAVRLAIETSRNGAWVREPATPVMHEEAAPLGLRAEATRVLAGRGFTHVLMHEADHAAPDVRNRAEAWNLRFLGERAGYRLYALR